MDAPDIVWVLWSATVGRESSIAARVEAAHTAGFTQLSVSPEDIGRAADEGTSAAELGRQLRAEGLEIVLDPVMNWYGDALDDVFHRAEDLGVVAVAAIGPFAPDDVPSDQLPARFAAFCDRAGEVGARVQLEFMPFSAVTDLASAWAIVEGADPRYGGIAVDTWHFFRGNPDFELLARLPGDRIFGVQVCDAPVEVRGTLSEDTFHRLLPGDGSFDLERVLRVLDEIGGLRWVGPEVLSPTTAAMAPVDAARLAGDRVRELIDRVRAPRP
ncbi:MAG: TIM barrel protein [Acidimicrobiales bacterium]